MLVHETPELPGVRPSQECSPAARKPGHQAGRMAFAFGLRRMALVPISSLCLDLIGRAST